MDKAIDKGNLIDFFAVLVPGMFSVILCCILNLSIFSFDIVADTLSNLAILIIIFVIISYIAGLLLLELAVIFQRKLPNIFNYYRLAIKEDVLNKKKLEPYEITTAVNKQEEVYEKKEFWLLTHNYAELVERKKAYSMMNRSLVIVPIAYVPVQFFITFVVTQGTWPAYWQLFLVFVVEILFYHRARRQAKVHYYEVNRIYESVFIKVVDSKS